MNGRKIALNILQEVEEGGYLNLCLKRHLVHMEEQEKRFISALVFTTLENQGRIDYIIDSFTQGKRVHRLIRDILRLGVAQLLFFESVPESAAVNECVKLTEQSSKRQLKGFVNAVLRSIAREAGAIAYPEPDTPEFLSVFYSYPQWLVDKYIADYGFDFTEEMVAFRKSAADTCVRANTLRLSTEELRRKLDGAGLRYAPGKYLPDALYIRNITAVDRMPLFQKGLLAVQGEASMLVVAAADIAEGQRVIDVCAAPGGKSALVAQAQPSRLMALDSSTRRVELMQENFARLGIQAEVAVADAAVPEPGYYGAFDRVIVDVPCSALGLAYRKPDIKYARRQEEITALLPVQKNILETCSRYVRPGGTLVYSTCTINRQENDAQINDFLGRHGDFVERRLADYLPEALMPRCRGGRLQLFPHIDGVDGFFIAALERRAK